MLLERGPVGFVKNIDSCQSVQATQAKMGQKRSLSLTLYQRTKF